MILSGTIDLHFIQFIESKETGVHFNRIDSDLSESMKRTDQEDDREMGSKLDAIFKSALNKEQLKLQVEHLKALEMPAMVLLSEQSRRMQDMSALFGRGDMKNMFPDEETLVLNADNDLIKSIARLGEQPDKKEEAEMICRHVYDLAMLSHKQLEPAAMTEFITRSNKILSLLAQEREG